MNKFVTLQLNKSGLVAEDGLPEARVETRAISTPEIRATNFSRRYSAVEKWKYSCGDINPQTV